MHDTDDTAEIQFVPGIGNFIASGGDACGALKKGLEEDAMSGKCFLDDREDLSFRIEKCSNDGLVFMKMAKLCQNWLDREQ